MSVAMFVTLSIISGLMLEVSKPKPPNALVTYSSPKEPKSTVPKLSPLPIARINVTDCLALNPAIPIPSIIVTYSAEYAAS